MRYLLILMFFLFIENSNAQDVKCHPYALPVECVILNQIAIKYVNDPDVTIIYQPYSPLIKAFNGITYQYNKYLYQISLSAFRGEELERLWALMHEMGHVMDFHEGRLEQGPVRWKGKEYTEWMEWKDRPWEKSAEKWAGKFWKKTMGFPPPSTLTNNMREFKCTHK